MPNDLTQQEWLEHKLSFMGITVGTEAMQAAALIAAWPSSPQGLAAKQVVEVAEKALDALRAQFRGWQAHDGSEVAPIPELDSALEAARKAGLG